MVATWLGLAKLGAVPALINYNLREESLLHSVAVVRYFSYLYKHKHTASPGHRPSYTAPPWPQQ